MTGAGRKVLKGWGSGRHTPCSGVMGIKIQGAGARGSGRVGEGREGAGGWGSGVSLRCDMPADTSPPRGEFQPAPVAPGASRRSEGRRRSQRPKSHSGGVLSGSIREPPNSLAKPRFAPSGKMFGHVFWQPRLRILSRSLTLHRSARVKTYYIRNLFLKHRRPALRYEGAVQSGNELFYRLIDVNRIHNYLSSSIIVIACIVCKEQSRISLEQIVICFWIAFKITADGNI